MRGWLGVALRRAADDAALVLAAALVVLVAAGVLVAAAIYPDAIVRAGVARTLAAADPVASGISVTIDVRQPDAATFDATVRELIAGALGPAAGDIGLTGMSEAYGLPNGDAETAPATRFAFADGIDSHAHLLRGAWPVDAGPTTGPGADIEAAIGDQAARTIGVDAGSTLDVTSRLDRNRRFTVRIVGVYAVDDPADAFWGGDPLLLSGTQQQGPFTTVGPLVIGHQVLLDRTIVNRATLAWRAVPRFGSFAPENLGPIGGNVGALPDRLAGRLGRGQAIVVRTDLPRLLGAVSNGLAQAGSGSTLVAGQMVVLAMYALIFVAALVVGQRRATTGLLRARGASSRHLVGLALLEALVIAAPAVVVGLPLGLALAAFLADSGPSVSAATAIAPAVVRLSQPVAGLAAVAGLVAVVGLTLPTALAAGPLARIHRSPGRQRAAALLQRSRVDLALAFLGVLALWRLRDAAGAADVTATPLAAAGPAIGLLAGAILLLRVVPAIGRAMEQGLVRGGSMAGALSVRSVARRSGAYARPALLFAMSAAIGLFAVGYARTWQASQRDQAAHAVGADVRGQVGPGAALDEAEAAARYRATPGVTAATPVAHQDFATGSALQHGMLLAVVPEAMRSIAAFRPDLGQRPFADLMAGLVAARPDPPMLALPSGARRVRVHPDLRLAPVGGAANLPSGWAGLSAGIVIRDANGLLHRLASAPALGTPDDAFVVALPDAGSDPGARAAAILAVELHLALPGGQVLSGSVGIRTIETSATTDGDDWAPIDAGATRGTWSIIRSAFDIRPTALPSPPGSGPGDLIAGTITAQAALTGPGTATLVARPTALADLVAAPMAGLVDPTLLAATGASPGDVILVRHASSITERIKATDAIAAFPGLAVDGIAVVDLGTFQLAGYAADGTLAAPDEWWLSVAPGADRSVVAALGVGPGALQGLRSRAVETESRINDPIALAISGMLVLAAAAAGAFAAIGFAAAAWASTQSRLAEFAVARALGLSRRQVVGWLVLEQAFPTLIGVVWGIVLGLALEWLVLPAVTLAPGGGPALPAAIIAVPLDLVVGYLGIAAVLVGGAAVILSRTVVGAGMTEPLRGES